MQLRFGGAHVGALLDKLRRQAYRQIRRQPQRGEAETISPAVVRKTTDQRQQYVVLLFQLLLQRRQRRLRGRHFRLLRQHVGARGGADIELIVDDAELIGFCLDDVERRVDLSAQRSLLDGGRHDVRGQCQISRFELEALIFGLRLRRLDLPPLTAEYVGRIGDVYRSLVQIEDRRIARPAECRRRELLPLRRRVGIGHWQELAALDVKILLCLPQRRLGRLKARIGLQGFGDQTVELLGVKHRPPLTGNIAARCRTFARPRRRHRSRPSLPDGLPACSQRPVAPAAPRNRGRPHRPRAPATTRPQPQTEASTRRDLRAPTHPSRQLN